MTLILLYFYCESTSHHCRTWGWTGAKKFGLLKSLPPPHQLEQSLALNEAIGSHNGTHIPLPYVKGRPFWTGWRLVKVGPLITGWVGNERDSVWVALGTVQHEEHVHLLHVKVASWNEKRKSIEIFMVIKIYIKIYLKKKKNWSIYYSYRNSKKNRNTNS